MFNLNIWLSKIMFVIADKDIFKTNTNNTISYLKDVKILEIPQYSSNFRSIENIRE